MIRAAILAGLLAASAAHAGDQRLYDERGRSLGTISRDGRGTATYRDERGRTTGTATTDSQGTTVFRDDRGRTVGRSSR